MARKVEADPRPFHCPNCTMKTAQILTCPRCHTRGCVEFCIPGGVGTVCAKCEEEDD